MIKARQKLGMTQREFSDAVGSSVRTRQRPGIVSAEIDDAPDSAPAGPSHPSRASPDGRRCRRYESGGISALEDALAFALAEAARAGRWDIVAQLARELEARRT